MSYLALSTRMNFFSLGSYKERVSTPLLQKKLLHLLLLLVTRNGWVNATLVEKEVREYGRQLAL